MQKLLLPLLVSLFVLGPVSVPAQALSLPLPSLPTVVDEGGDEVEAADESGAEEDEGGEASDDCVIEDEEDVQICAEIAAEEREEAEQSRPQHRGKHHRPKSKSAHRRHQHRSRHHRANRARHQAS
jgi:hypothetical protein